MATSNIYAGMGYLGADLYGDMSSNEKSGVLMGGASGAAVGTMIMPGLGTAAGFAIGAGIGYLQGDMQDDAAEEEARQLEEARIAAVRREFGIIQSKQNMAVARASQGNRREGGGGAPKNDSGDIASRSLNDAGFIGQNIVNTGGTTPSSSGTF